MVKTWKKALDDYSNIEYIRKNISDREIELKLRNVQLEASNFLNYLEDNPETIEKAGKFIYFYQNKLLEIIEKYYKLEKSNLQNNDLSKIKSEIIDVLEKYIFLYEEELNEIISAKIMDTSINVSSLNEVLKTEDKISKEKKQKVDLSKIQLRPEIHSDTNNINSKKEYNKINQNNIFKKEIDEMIKDNIELYASWSLIILMIFFTIYIIF